MALSGQLNDLSLGELIEFFCNQRKTGRLKVDYALAPGVFFIKEGDLVDAKVGALNGAEAVYFALSLPSASFDFSPGMQSSRRTINEAWAKIILEGLRRVDEGILPDASLAFDTEEEIDDATIAYLNCIQTAKEETAAQAAKQKRDEVDDEDLELPLSLTVDATNESNGTKKFALIGVAAAVVLACVVAAFPLAKHFSHSNAPVNAAPAPVAAQTALETPSEAPASSSDPAEAAENPANAAKASAVVAAAADEAARREREREARMKKLAEAAKRNDSTAQATTTPAAASPAPAPASGPKTVRVTVTYDEAGRVTQASAAGASPGAEAYAGTAVRIARGRHFAPGKAGTTTVTIPIN